MNTKAEDWEMEEAMETGRPKVILRYGEIAAALAKAQAEMHNPKFDASNPFFKSKFASLAAVRNAVIPMLAKYGICLTQDLTTTEGAISCRTILTHASGQQMIFGPLTLPISKADAQGYAAAGTYAKRISMQSVVAVVGDDDDDGESMKKTNGHTNEVTDKQRAATHGRLDEINGDLGRNVAPAEAERHAITMRSILQEDVEHRIKALKVLDYHHVINKDQDLYGAASKFLTPAERSEWKAYRDEAKQQEADDRKVTNVGKRF